MKQIASILALWILCLSAGQSLADQPMYVTDEYTITLRTGPSLENKVIANLKNDTRLEKIKDEGTWMLVRTPDGKEGWVMKRYITTKTPLSVQFEEYKAKNQEMIAKAKDIETIVSRYEEDKRSLSEALEQTRSALEAITREYAALKENSADVAGLKSRHDQALAQSAQAARDMERIRAENEELKDTRDMRWFLAGGAVVVFGWLSGLIMGSLGRKRRSSRLSF